MVTSDTTKKRSYTAGSSTGKSLVAIVVPLSDRNTFTADEKTSLKHLDKHLGAYDRYLALPEHLDLKMTGFGEKRFAREFFGSVEANKRLMFSRLFYESFSDYQYILIYHLDALVFTDKLQEWCHRGFDYIAPPWIVHADAPYHGNPEYEGKVGNGGFSLRRIEAFLSVLNSRRLWKNPIAYAKSALKYGTSLRKYFIFLKLPLYLHYRHNGVLRELASSPHNEDHFWASRAGHYLTGFKVAPLMTALDFAFECVPRYCFELNGKQLPFGCHAWGRYDRSFWEPYLLS